MRLPRTLALASLLPLTFACGSEEPEPAPRFASDWGWTPADGSRPLSLTQNPANGHLYVGLQPAENAEEPPVGPGIVLSHAGDELAPLRWYDGCDDCAMASPGRGFLVGEKLLLGPDVGVSGLYEVRLSDHKALPVVLDNPRGYPVEFTGFDARTGAVRADVERILLPGPGITEIGFDGLISDSYDAPAPVRQLLQIGQDDYLAILTGPDGNDLLGRWSPTAPRLESWASATVEGMIVQLATGGGWTVAVVEREPGFRTLATVDLETGSLEPLGDLVVPGDVQIAVRPTKQEVVVAVGMVFDPDPEDETVFPAQGDLILLDAAGKELDRTTTPVIEKEGDQIHVSPLDVIVAPNGEAVYVAHMTGVTGYTLP